MGRWSALREGLFRPIAEREGRRGPTPNYKGAFPAPNGTTGHYVVDAGGLHLDFVGGHGVHSSTGTASHGRFRQALVPSEWDGERVVVIIAGAGVYAACYSALVAHLLTPTGEQGAAAVVWEDVPGYGYSAAGRRFADIRHIDEILMPQIGLFEEIRGFLGTPRARTVALGCSLGGQLALHLACRRPELVAGVIALAPLVRISGSLGSAWVRRALGALAPLPYLGDRYIYRDRFRGADYKSSSADWYHPDYLTRKIEDPYFDDSAIIRAVHAIVLGGNALLSMRPAEDLPVRIVHSTHDGTCDYGATVTLAKAWTSLGANVELEELRDYPHQLLHLKEPSCYSIHARIDRHLQAIWARPSS